MSNLKKFQHYNEIFFKQFYCFCFSLHEEYIPNNHQWHKIAKRESVGDYLDCCPSVTEMVEPEGGKNVDGEYVNLYRSGNYTQR